MDAKTIMARMVSNRSGLSFKDIYGRDFEKDDWNAFNDARRFIHQAPVYMQCGMKLTTQQIRAFATKSVKQHGARIVFIDYLQFVKHARAENQRLAVASTCQEFRVLAQDLQVPVVCLAQLNRDAASDRPRVSNLKETGSIEEDSDIIVLIDRKIDGEKQKSYTIMDAKSGTKREVDMDNEAVIIVAKDRNGPKYVSAAPFSDKNMRFG
jgi:replicative DNA helicase